MDTLEKLLTIEEIKQLKARYFRFIDTRNISEFLNLFTADVEWIWYAEDNVTVNARYDGIVAFERHLTEIGDPLERGFTVHHGHMPEIEVVDDRNARGIWAMVDYVFVPGVMEFTGYGHYHEEYVKGDDGVWRISKSHITRLHVDYPDGVKVSAS